MGFLEFNTISDDIMNSQKFESQAINFLNLRKVQKHDSLVPEEISQLYSLICSDIPYLAGKILMDYFSTIFSEIPAVNLPLLLDEMVQIETPAEILEKFAIYLLKSNCPIFQIKALKIVQQLRQPFFIPLIYPFVFGTHKPLAQVASAVILENPGNVEILLEQTLTDRSKQKRLIAFRLLNQINPNNIKLLLIQMEDPDFLTRIVAIEKLGNIKDRKWIDRIATALNDNDTAVQKAAIDALTQIGGKKVKKILSLKLAYENYPPIQEILRNSIGKASD